ncbi:hypothetical protein [Chryseobacterium indoltheticum]|uniref:HEPN domain-containing protein n=1 Tax=Chryseobacterium indoltheticum TaxID=254 RepID=A0A381FJB5_9FLAO|nr:hypothetical protein [Chryseobacterium indoltheticum]SUX46629.1 Uncharacterised protein [Chryseobacterium indoltheticum]
MSVFKNRSEINFASAKLLHDNDNYPSVAHCAYYSCYQYMMHLWTTKMGKTVEDLKSLCAYKGIGSHTALINEIKIFIESQNNDDKRLFNTLITQLKTLRLNSDYTEETIDFNNSKDCITNSENSIKILKKYQ